MGTKSKVAMGVSTFAMAATMVAAQNAKKVNAKDTVYNTVKVEQSTDGKLLVYTDNFKLTDTGHPDVLGLIRMTTDKNDSSAGCNNFTRTFEDKNKDENPDLTDVQKKELSGEVSKTFKACMLRQQ